MRPRQHRSLVAAVPGAAFAAASEQPLTLKKAPAQGAQAGQNVLPTEELRDIQGPVALAAHPPYWEIGVAVALLLAILAGVYLFLKRRRRPPPATPPAPWETALAELAAARKLQGQGLLYMARVSEILRRYIESRFAIRSTRQTTREFLTGLSRTGEGSPLAPFTTELRACLERADMAKFARQVPEQDHLVQIEMAVTGFIKKTEPAAGGGP